MKISVTISVLGMVMFAIVLSAFSPAEFTHRATLFSSSLNYEVTPTPAILPTNISTSSGLDSLVVTASALCEKAFKSSLKKQTSSAPLMTLLETTYVEAIAGQWRYIKNAEQVNPFLEARSADTVKTLACMRISRSKVGSYSDGASAYIIKWTIRLVTWPEGIVTIEKIFSGGRPPQVKVGGGDGYGMTPSKEYRQWLLDLYAGDSLFVQTSTYGVSSVESIAFSPDGKYMAASGNDYSANIWDIATHKVVYAQTGERNISTSFIPLAFPADQKILAMGKLGGVNLLSDKIWKRRVEIKGVDVWDVAFSQDGSKLIAGMSRGYDGVRLYSASDGNMLRNYGLKSPVSQVLFSPQDKYLLGLIYTCASCPPNAESGIFVWDFTTSQLLRNIKVSSPLSMAILNDANSIAVAVDKAKEVQLYSLLDGNLVGKLNGHAEPVTLLAASPDGRWLASTDEKGNVIIWDQQTSQIAFTYVSPARVTAMAFTPQGNNLALGSVAGVIEMWNFQ